MNICKDCKYFAPDNAFHGERRYKYAWCQHPRSKSVDLVSGKLTYMTAEHMRFTRNEDTLCNIEGQFYDAETSVVTKTLRNSDIYYYSGIFYPLVIPIVLMVAIYMHLYSKLIST